MLGKKAASICIIIIGIIVAIPFNYIYGIDGFEVFYLLKNSAKLKPI